MHWHSSHYAVMHARDKNSNIQGRSLNVVIVIFHTIRNFSQSKEFAPSGSKFFLFKRSSNFEKGRN